MACRDASTGKAKPIPQLIVTTPEEVALQKLGKNQKDKKIALAQTSLDSHQPNEEESARLYKLFMGNEALFEGRAVKPDNMLWMSETASSRSHDAYRERAEQYIRQSDVDASARAK